MMNLNVNAMWVWVWARMWVWMWMCSLCSDCVQCTCSICLSRPPTVRRCAPFRSPLGWLVDSLFFREHTQSPPPLNQRTPPPLANPHAYLDTHWVDKWRKACAQFGMTFDTALWRIPLSHAVGCAAMPIISLGPVMGGVRVAGVAQANPQFSCPSMVLHLSLSCCPRTDWFSFWCLRPMYAERPFEWPLTSQRQLQLPTPAQSHAPNQWVSLSIRAAGIRPQSHLIWLIEGDSSLPPFLLPSSFPSTSFAPSMQNVCWFICITAWHFYRASHNCLPTLSMALIKLINRIH